MGVRPTAINFYKLVDRIRLEQEPGGVNLAEKVTNFDMVSNDLHI